MAKRKRKTEHPKLPNGFGRITEIKKKNLRNPFRAMVTIGKDEEGRPIGKILGYYASWYDAYDALVLYRQNPYELSRDTVTVSDLYERWSKEYFSELSGKSSSRTIIAAWEYVTPQFRRLNVSSIKPQTIKDFILNDAFRLDKDGKTLHPSDGVKSRMKSMFNLMFDYAVLADLVDHNPARLFSLKGIQGKIEKNRKDKNPISRAHEQELWADLEYGYTRMVLINIYSPWRPEELVQLKKESIDLCNMTMTGGMKTAAGRDRLVPIHPEIQDLVRYYYDKSSGEMLFYDYDKPRPAAMTYDKYRGRFTKIMNRHGWSDYSPSCPRHTFSTRAKEAKMDELARKLIMGHEITDVTDKHYTHMDMLKYLSDEMSKIQKES